MFKKSYKNSLIFLTIISFFVCFILEALLRRSFDSAFSFMIESPGIFIFNMIIIMFSMSWGLITKRRNFAFTLMPMLWILLGIGNYILNFFRLTPLCGSDFLIIKDALGIANLYLSVWQMILAVLVLIAFIFGMVALFIKGRKTKCHYKMGILTIVVLLSLVVGVTNSEAIKTDASDLPESYKNCGFPYSFLNTVFKQGIAVPEGYSQKVFMQLLDKIEKTPDKAPKVKPNIIFVQLESFFDIAELKGLTLSENPIPNFTNLKKNFSSGYLKVPTFGGQTANTEFEVLTGFDVSFFGAGECPFETTVDSLACESIATNLKDIGYKTHAIHNHTGTFYKRNLVYPNLGFDTFTPVEYMNNIERNIMTWAKDKILLRYIKEALNSTKETDFVYTVTAQAHGNYPKIFVQDASKISVTGKFSEEEKNKYTYYANQLYETDEFIGNLVKELETIKEPTVLVLYGDHLPAFKIENKDLKSKDIYKTEYIIWDNMNLKKENKELNAYHLSAHILSKLGIASGDNNKLNIYYKNDPDYKTLSKALAYNVFKLGETRHLRQYERASTQMGVIKPEIEEVFFSDGDLVVTGKGFSPYSIITINGVKKQTGYIYEKALVAYGADEYDNSKETSLRVSQITQSGELLSQSEPHHKLAKK